MSLSAPKKYIKNNKSNSARIFRKKNEKFLCIEECKKLYQKYYSYPSSSLLKQLNENNLKIYLEQLNSKDISVISILLSKYFFIQQIEFSLNDPNKTEPKPKRKIYKPIILSKEEKTKIEKEKKNRLRDIKNMINKIIISLGNHLSSSKSIISLSINNIELTEQYCDYLSKGIIDNKSLQSLSITNSRMLLNPYELLLESLLNHNLLCYLDLSNNNLDDKYAKMVSRIIIRQTQRRDQVVWSYGLRNELPLTNDYKKGLIFLNLNSNNLSRDSCDSIANALYSDQYIRAIYLNNNKFDNNSCKKFIYMMRKNLSLLTIDLRENPGYDDSIHSRLVMKMSKNIRYLYQQYKKGEYSEEEFENFKIFIDVTFFDVDIPQNVVDFYNSNLPENYEENENKLSTDNIKAESEEKKLMTEINNKRKNSIENRNEIENGIDLRNGMSKSVDILEENKKLHKENIRLKQQIIELKAKKLQKYLKGEEIINKKNKNKDDESKSDIENDYQKVELLIKELNDLMNKIDQKKAQQKEKSDKKIKEEKTSDKNKNKDKEENTIKNINNNINKINNKEEVKKVNKKINSNIKEIIFEEKDETSQKDNFNNNSNEKADKEDTKIMNGNINILKENNEKEEDKNEEDKKININNNNINMINKEEIKNESDIPYKKEENEEEKDKESNGSHFVDENGNIYNFDDLTEEEKMLIIQQQLIIQRLQEEAEARGEHFDPQDYIEFLERQAKEEEDEEEITGQSTNQINKSF